MSPTIVLKDGKPVLVTGTPGGSRIISAVTQVIVNSIDYKMNIAAAVAAPRIHHQWLPDNVRAENGFPPEVLAGLTEMGHSVLDTLGQTSANSIAIGPNGPLGAPDPRTRGAWAAGQ
jgi:gamma-glutamyltranspeptidase/glutathione hydrolase